MLKKFFFLFLISLNVFGQTDVELLDYLLRQPKPKFNLIKKQFHIVKRKYLKASKKDTSILKRFLQAKGNDLICLKQKLENFPKKDLFQIVFKEISNPTVRTLILAHFYLEWKNSESAKEIVDYSINLFKTKKLT